MNRKRILVSLLAVFLFSVAFAFLGTKPAKASGDLCYCSDGDYYYNSYRGTEGIDYGSSTPSGYCRINYGGYDAKYSDWLRTECDDPYGEGNLADWSMLFWPDYPRTVGWHNKVYVYIPTETSTATGARYYLSYYPDWPAGWPIAPTWAYFTVNQSIYSNQWIVFSGWYQALYNVGTTAFDSCPEGQQLSTDDVIQRWCRKFDEPTQTCKDGNWPTGGFSPRCGPNF